MKRVILGLVVFVLVVVAYFLFSSSKVDSSVSVVTNSVELNLDEELELPPLDKELLEDKEENLSLDDIDKALKEEKPMEIKEVEPEMVADVKDIMVETTMSEVQKEFPSKEGITPTATIALAQGVISKLKVGDTISLPYMGNGEFDAKITKKTTHKNGSVTVTGNLVDTGNQYAVVLTEGKKMSFATVTTPNGSYEIETRNGVGYVYATDDIDKKWIDHSKEDVLIPHGD
jgi:hypothetical protein